MAQAQSFNFGANSIIPKSSCRNANIISVLLLYWGGGYSLEVRLIFGASAHSARKWFPGNGCIFVSSRTLPERGSRKMGGSLVPARTLQENGSHEMVLSLLSGRALPKNGSLKVVALLVSARTLPNKCSKEIAVFSCQRALRSTRRWFPQNGWNFGASVNSARKWFPEKWYLFRCQPALCRKGFPENCCMFGVSAHSARKWFPENGSELFLGFLGVDNRFFPEMALGEIELRFATRIVPNRVSQNAARSCAPGHTLANNGSWDCAGSFVCANICCRHHPNNRSNFPCECETEEIVPQIRSALHVTTVQFQHTIQQIDPTSILRCMLA